MSKSVKEVMKGEVHTATPDTRLPQLQRRFLETRVGALPVVDREGTLRGIVSRSDVVRRHSLEQALAELADSHFDATLGVDGTRDAIGAIGEAVGRRLAALTAGDIMISDVVSIGPDDSLADAARRMIGRGIHRLPVVEDGRLVGILSAFDFMREYAENEP